MPTPRQLKNMLDKERDTWIQQVDSALLDIGKFAAGLAMAIGEISREEAVTAVQRKAREVLDGLR